MSGLLTLDAPVPEERTSVMHPELAGLAASRLLATRVGSATHHCNDCGRELHHGARMVWAVAMNLPFCWGCASWRRITWRAEPTRSWAP